MGVIISTGTLNVEASQYIGECCWEMKLGATPRGSMNLGVSHLGGSHYTVSGKWNFDTLYIVQGNAEIDGDNVLMTLVFTGRDDDNTMVTGTGLATLDATTLSGTFDHIGHDHNPSDQPAIIGNIYLDSDTEHDVFDMNFIPCP